MKSSLPWHLGSETGLHEEQFLERNRFLPGFHLSQADELASSASIILELWGTPGGPGLSEAPILIEAFISLYYTDSVQPDFYLAGNTVHT